MIPTVSQQQHYSNTNSQNHSSYQLNQHNASQIHQNLEQNYQQRSDSFLAQPLQQKSNNQSITPCTRKEAWTIQDFKNVQSIGQGKFGKVFRAIEKNSNKQVALKMVYKNQLEQYDFFTQMKKELEIQWRLRHPNIIRLFGYFYDEKNIYVVLEYAQYGNLYQKLRKEKYFNEDKARVVIRQVVEGLVYMQERNVIHRDIKPENILIMDAEKIHNYFRNNTLFLTSLNMRYYKYDY